MHILVGQPVLVNYGESGTVEGVVSDKYRDQNGVDWRYRVSFAPDWDTHLGGLYESELIALPLDLPASREPAEIERWLVS